MDPLLSSLIIQFVQLHKILSSHNGRRKKLLLEKKTLLERQRNINRSILALCLRRRRRRMFQRSSWVHPELLLRQHGRFWETAVPQYTDERFQKKFRLSRATFQSLCNTLRPHLVKQDTCMRKSIIVEKRVAIALTFIKGNCDFWSVADLYGVGKSTVGFLLYQFCDAVLSCYYHNIIKFPDTKAERLEISKGFMARWKFPGCFGAMDGTHIPILAPPEYPKDYYNYKSFHSIVTLAVVDHKYRFMYINIGASGRCNDASIFRRSTLFKKFAGTDDNIAKQTTNLHIISDAAFPLLPWLLKPYPITSQMPLVHRNFNFRLSSARMTIENAFGRLKGRWRILLKRADLNVENIKKVAEVCFVLHNICESSNEVFHQDWLDEVRREENRATNVPTIPVAENRAPTVARIKRDMIAEQLMDDELQIMDYE